MNPTRKAIYLKDGSIWDEMVAEAERVDRSVSSYLVNCHRIVKDMAGQPSTAHLDKQDTSRKRSSNPSTGSGGKRKKKSESEKLGVTKEDQVGK